MPGRPRSWTDEDLIRAVEQSSTISEVLRRLGLSRGGGAFAVVRRRILELGLDKQRPAQSVNRSGQVQRTSYHPPWTEDELRWAVATSTSLRQVMQRLGQPPSGSKWAAARAQIVALDLETSHFGRAVPAAPRRAGGRRRSWSDEELRAAVACSRSVAGVLRHLGLQPGGDVYVTVQRRMRELGLDRSHFTGKGWRRGTFTPVKPGRPLEEILVEDSPMVSTAHLRKRLLREQILDPVCSSCGRTEWNDQPIPLQLDHINGDRTDNRLSNLRLLCPNCHAQTETWCSKNRGRYDRLAPVLELVYRPRSKWGAFGHEGSTPSGRTIQLSFGDLDDLD